MNEQWWKKWNVPIISGIIIWTFWQMSGYFGWFNGLIDYSQQWSSYQMVDILITLFGFIITIMLLAFVFVQIKLQITGQNHNVDVESSKILNEYYRRFYDEHKNIQMEITSKKTITYDEEKLDGFLEDFEYLGIMHHIGLIKFEHIFEVFASLLLEVRNDEQIKQRIEYMKNKYSNKKIKTYSKLEDLMEKIYKYQNS